MGIVMTDERENGIIVGCCLPIIAMILLACLGWKWYRAGVQSDVYQREGITISQWEVFVGSKPAERAIRIVE